MQDESSPAYSASRPYVRFWLTIALGMLGVLLFRARGGFNPSAFANLNAATILTWLAAAFAGVLLLQRMERRAVPRGLCLLVGLTLPLALLLPQDTGRPHDAWERAIAGFVWFSCILLLVTVGAWIIRWRLRNATRPVRWFTSLGRAPFIALTAPFLLFASRPVDIGTASSAAHRLSRAALKVFPHILMLAFALALALTRKFRTAAVCASMPFTPWAWLGCALLFLLSPWPDNPRFPKTDHLSWARRAGSLATVAFVAIALVLLERLGASELLPWFIYPMLMWGAFGCVLTAVLVPWPEYPPIPRLAELPTRHKTGPLATAVFLTMPLLGFGWSALGPVHYVLSGQLFASGFDRAHRGPWFVYFACFGAFVYACVASARWMSDRTTRLGYWAFAIPSVVLVLSTLSMLTIPFYWLLQYIDAMGYTDRRAAGVAYSLAAYVVVLAFACWAVWPPKRREISV